MAKCQKCNKERLPKNMSAIDIDVSEKVYKKGYGDPYFWCYLCDECLIKLYKFLGIKANKKESKDVT